MSEVTAKDRTGSASAYDKWIAVVRGDRLLEARLERGWSQSQLAWKAGVSICTVSKLENEPRGRCRPRTAGRLATALGDDPELMLSDLLGMDRPLPLRQIVSSRGPRGDAGSRGDQ